MRLHDFLLSEKGQKLVFDLAIFVTLYYLNKNEYIKRKWITPVIGIYAGLPPFGFLNAHRAALPPPAQSSSVQSTSDATWSLMGLALGFSGCN